MNYTVVIPARFASTRLPGKPLLDIAGKPMIQRVYEQATQSRASRVVIATDDQRIVDAANDFGAEALMTSADHPSGTDRLQEVAQLLSLADDEIVVNVQGDEPLLPPGVIDQVAQNLAVNREAAIATLIEPIGDIDTLFDANTVKAVVDHSGKALYFSRAPIPWAREEFSKEPKTLPAATTYYRHIGIYAYRVYVLNQFVQWPESVLESTEKLEQLRAMENGAVIHAATSIADIPGGVDTEQDLIKVRDFFN